MNIRGYENVDEVLLRGTTRLSVDEFDRLTHDDHVLVLDTRAPSQFKKGFIPGSWNIGLDGSFAVWAGTLIKDIDQKILVVAERGREKEAVTRLARVGYDHAIGYLDGGFEAWQRRGLEVDRIPFVSAAELAMLYEKKNVNILDVRKKSEFDSEHVIGATNAPLDYLEDSVEIIDRTRTYYIHCAGGYRSVIFASILKSKGYENLVDVEGGFAAIKDTGRFALSEFKCPTTML
jgi:rhodanese-related sulfurtransferase